MSVNVYIKNEPDSLFVYTLDDGIRPILIHLKNLKKSSSLFLYRVATLSQFSLFRLHFLQLTCFFFKSIRAVPTFPRIPQHVPDREQQHQHPAARSHQPLQLLLHQCDPASAGRVPSVLPPDARHPVAAGGPQQQTPQAVHRCHVSWDFYSLFVARF